MATAGGAGTSRARAPRPIAAFRVRIARGAGRPEPGPDSEAPADETAPAASGDEPAGDGPRGAALSLNEHAAFREIARALGARFAGDPDGAEAVPPAPSGPVHRGAVTPFRGVSGQGHALARLPERGAESALARLVERLPIGLLVHRGDEVLLANRHLLALAGYDTLEAWRRRAGPG